MDPDTAPQIGMIPQTFSFSSWYTIANKVMDSADPKESESSSEELDPCEIPIESHKGSMASQERPGSSSWETDSCAVESTDAGSSIFARRYRADNYPPFEGDEEPAVRGERDSDDEDIHAHFVGFEGGPYHPHISEPSYRKASKLSFSPATRFASSTTRGGAPSIMASKAARNGPSATFDRPYTSMSTNPAPYRFLKRMSTRLELETLYWSTEIRERIGRVESRAKGGDEGAVREGTGVADRAEGKAESGRPQSGESRAWWDGLGSGLQG
ncbi:hypothetical protein B9Z65_3130 [Elsinoe australis]|uniref:Uncharacterized protein n=1 Tax=Elsinoe australis TaxID=40998 RepID=A0A2P7ZUI0_9PEZI|nr:hypothetical protein B9Z65_3130 [Elsinoe australis]